MSRNPAPLGCVLLALAGGACGERSERSHTDPDRRLVVLGFDGMDPKVLQDVIDEGRAPNLVRLAERGTYLPLKTSNPPQSPVAWANFITGMEAVGHGIYDFVHRDAREMSPYLSTSRATPPTWSLPLPGGWHLPLAGGGMELLREGEPFWAYLQKAGVPSSIVKIPSSFPPDTTGAKTLSGMGTPDLMGTYGTYQVLTDDPELLGRKLSAGRAHKLEFGADGVATAALEGPPHPYRKDGRAVALPVRVALGEERRSARVRLGDEDVLLLPGEWSSWVPLAFDPGTLAGNIGGMVRLYLKSLSPRFVMYVSPINIDPTSPVMPISSPEDYAKDLADRVGRFYTQGMPEDTKALAGGVLSEQEFLAQAELVFQERLKLLEAALDDFETEGGFLFFYFSSVDQLSHMFFRSLDPDAPPELSAFADVIPRSYQRHDTVVGRVIERIGIDTPLVVMSDHGFTHYRFKVGLNAWLREKGYLTPAEAPGPGPLGHIDWSATQVYALGLNQLYVNLAGREREGVVPAAERDVLLRRLTRELLSWRDPRTARRVVTSVERPPVGAHPELTPDLIVGFADEYRSSDESATGIFTGETLAPNHDKWSGDHCMDPDAVPGVLFTSRKLGVTDPGLTDMAPAILAHFGVTPPPTMKGRALWAPEEGP